MPAARLLALASLALLVIAAAGTLLLPLGCEDVCAPDCGDCLACSLVADVTVSAPSSLGLVSAGVLPGPAPFFPSASPRLLDHVPLSPTA